MTQRATESLESHQDTDGSVTESLDSHQRSADVDIHSIAVSGIPLHKATSYSTQKHRIRHHAKQTKPGGGKRKTLKTCSLVACELDNISIQASTVAVEIPPCKL